MEDKRATVVVGDSYKDELNVSSSLYNGETFGDASRYPDFDIAVDPVEGRGYLAKGLTNATTAIWIESLTTTAPTTMPLSPSASIPPTVGTRSSPSRPFAACTVRARSDGHAR